MQFMCKKTSSVSSITYVICSTISRKNFNEIITIYPKAQTHIMNKIINYKDPLKLFMEMYLNKISYFNDLPKHIKCDFMFNMELKSFEKGDYLYKVGDTSKTI